MKAISSILIALTASVMVYANDPAHKAQFAEAREKVNAACAEDAVKAGCSGDQVGHGLMKCLKKYKKEHADFTLSESCKSASKDLRAGRKEFRKNKKAQQEADTTELKK